MDFECSDETTMMQQSIAAFIKRVCTPEYARWSDESGEFPEKLWDGMAPRSY